LSYDHPVDLSFNWVSGIIHALSQMEARMFVVDYRERAYEKYFLHYQFRSPSGKGAAKIKEWAKEAKLPDGYFDKERAEFDILTLCLATSIRQSVKLNDMILETPTEWSRASVNKVSVVEPTDALIEPSFLTIACPKRNLQEITVI
jgi:hypothetical protein